MNFAKDDPTAGLTDASSRRATAAQLGQTGNIEKSLPIWREELRSGAAGANWVRTAILEAMQWRDLSLAAELSTLYAAEIWGSPWYPEPWAGDPARTLAYARPPRTDLSIAKLRHDIDQFRLLRERQVLGVEFDKIIQAYAEIAGRMTPAGFETRRPLAGADEARIGHVYNRIVHLASAPRTEQALSSTFDAAAAEDRYFEETPSLTVIDDFLSKVALKEIQRFCLESTVWSGTRYCDGRLGAFFIDGFSAPLLVQIAEEVRAVFPRLIGDCHPLRQLWGFKSAPFVPSESTIHADFAAVNVNLWVTPQCANLDLSSGGLNLYNITAPQAWDFDTYNRRPDLIAAYLRRHEARAVTIPYRENRAVIFDSSLFHATAPIRFRPEYEHRRVNITLLYGDRGECRSSRPNTKGMACGDPSAWRSRALRSAR